MQLKKPQAKVSGVGHFDFGSVFCCDLFIPSLKKNTFFFLNQIPRVSVGVFVMFSCCWYPHTHAFGLCNNPQVSHTRTHTKIDLSRTHTLCVCCCFFYFFFLVERGRKREKARVFFFFFNKFNCAKNTLDLKRGERERARVVVRERS